MTKIRKCFFCYEEFKNKDAYRSHLKRQHKKEREVELTNDGTELKITIEPEKIEEEMSNKKIEDSETQEQLSKEDNEESYDLEVENYLEYEPHFLLGYPLYDQVEYNPTKITEEDTLEISSQELFGTLFNEKECSSFNEEWEIVQQTEAETKEEVLQDSEWKNGENSYTNGVKKLQELALLSLHEYAKRNAQVEMAETSICNTPSINEESSEDFEMVEEETASYKPDKIDVEALVGDVLLFIEEALDEDQTLGEFQIFSLVSSMFTTKKTNSRLNLILHSIVLMGCLLGLGKREPFKNGLKTKKVLLKTGLWIRAIVQENTLNIKEVKEIYSRRPNGGYLNIEDTDAMIYTALSLIREKTSEGLLGMQTQRFSRKRKSIENVQELF